MLCAYDAGSALETWKGAYVYAVQNMQFEQSKETGTALTFGRLGTTCPNCGNAAWFEFDPPVSRADVQREPRKATCGGCSKPT